MVVEPKCNEKFLNNEVLKRILLLCLAASAAHQAKRKRIIRTFRYIYELLVEDHLVIVLSCSREKRQFKQKRFGLAVKMANIKS